MLIEIDGDILESDAKYIAHQCNCVTVLSAGLANKIFDKFEYADSYLDRIDIDANEKAIQEENLRVGIDNIYNPNKDKHKKKATKVKSFKSGSNIATREYKIKTYKTSYGNKIISDKSKSAIPGTIDIFGNNEDKRYIINMYSQKYPGKSKYGNDSNFKRLDWFRECLTRISKIDELESIAFPYGIGCGMAGGNWQYYYDSLNKFADYMGTNIDVFLINKD